MRRFLLSAAVGLILSSSAALFAQSPLPMPVIQPLDASGLIAAGGKLCTYAAGTNTPLATYADSALSTPNTNPVTLDSAGRAVVYVQPQTYKFVLRLGGSSYPSPDACTTGAVQWSYDNVGDVGLLLKANLANPTYGGALVAFTQAGTAALGRTLKDKLLESVTVADFGADDGAVQAAINAMHGRGGGTVTINFGIPTSIDLTTLTLYEDTILKDERYADLGHTIYHAIGDEELAIMGPSVNGGEGPAFVTQNSATTGDRTSSYCGLYGKLYGVGTPSLVGCQLWGYWDGLNWFPSFSLRMKASNGDVRDRFRFGRDGTFIFNPWGGATDKYQNPDVAYTNHSIVSINIPPQDGGGNLFEQTTTETDIRKPGHFFDEVWLDNKKAVLFRDAAGVVLWGAIPEFPVAGEFCIFEATVSNACKLVIVAGDANSIQLRGPLNFGITNTAGATTNYSLFLDAADSKLKWKDGAGSSFIVGGPAGGFTGTKVVKGSDGANCNLVFADGRMMSTTCP